MNGKTVSMITISSIVGVSYLGYKVHEYIYQDRLESEEKRSSRIVSILFSAGIGLTFSPFFMRIKESW